MFKVGDKVTKSKAKGAKVWTVVSLVGAGDVSVEVSSGKVSGFVRIKHLHRAEAEGR